MAKRRKYKHHKHKYLVIIEWSEEDQVYVAEVPELLGCATHGGTLEQAAENVSEAIESWIEGAKEANYPIPEPLATKQFSGKFVARVNPHLHRLIAMKAKTKGESLNKLVVEALKKEFA